jgi:hypothetical protein
MVIEDEYRTLVKCISVKLHPENVNRRDAEAQRKVLMVASLAVHFDG